MTVFVFNSIRARCAARKPAPRRSASSGFTLLELVAWFGIFSVACAVATPSLTKLIDTYHLHGAARRVYAEMQSLRVSAVAGNTRYRSALGNGGLRFDRFDLEKGAWEDLGVSASELSAVDVSASGEIVFAPNGTAPIPGSITLTNHDGAQKTVVVSSAGLVQIR